MQLLVVGDARESGQEIEAAEDIYSSNNSYNERAEKEYPINLETVVVIAELLEVALHTILYIRQIYPIDFFERRVKLGIPVFQCVHPSITEYISETVKSIGEEIAESNVAKFIISINKSETPLEKFMFSFDYDEEESNTSETDVPPMELIRRQARSMLLKLNAIDAMLLPLEPSDDLSFSVIMQLREGGGAFRISDEDLAFDVAEDDGHNSEVGAARELSCIENPSLVQIIRTGEISVHLHVQESEEKEHRRASEVPSDHVGAEPAK